MKNYVQPGNTIPLTAPYDVASGDGLLVGSIFGVAAGNAVNGLALEDWRAPAEEAGGVLWATVTRLRWSSGAKRYARQGSALPPVPQQNPPKARQ